MKLCTIDNAIYIRTASGLLAAVYYPARGVLEIRRNGETCEVPLLELVKVKMGEKNKNNGAALDGA